MPHERPGKEWLHLRDAICLGNVDAIIDQLTKEGLSDNDGRAYQYEDMQSILTAAKLQVGWDACAVVDKNTFQDSINYLITQTVNLYQPQDTQVNSYKESMVESRWDKVFNDMVGRASGRIAAGPGHYTKDTPQGALEGMEERLSNEGQFERRMTRQMVDNALHELNIKMSELQGAILDMATQTVPAPVVAQIQQAAEAIEEAAVQVTGGHGPAPSPKTAGIREYALSLGQDLANKDSTDIMEAMRAQFPDITRPNVLQALNAYWRKANNLPNLRRAARPTSTPPTPPTPPTGIPVEPMEGGEIEDLLGGLGPVRYGGARWY